MSTFLTAFTDEFVKAASPLRLGMIRGETNWLKRDTAKKKQKAPLPRAMNATAPMPKIRLKKVVREPAPPHSLRKSPSASR